MRQLLVKRVILLVAVATVAATMVAMSGAALAAPGSTDSKVSKELAKVRQATEKYQDVSAAEEAGYVDASGCVPGMGHHYANFPNLFDGKVGAGGDQLKPEVLLYAPTDEGMKLVAVEYLVFDADANPATVETHKLFGMQPFEGPMEHGLDLHYDLHVWTWQANPDGIFTAHNPNVQCPA